METLENNEQNVTSFTSTKEINDYLIETAKWGKLLAIVSFVSVALIVLVGLVAMLGFSQMRSHSNTAIVGVFYLLLTLIYYFPLSYLYKYSVQIKVGVNSNDTSTIAHGFQNLKSLFKFMGILTIVVLSIYGLILLVAVPTMLFLNN